MPIEGKNWYDNSKEKVRRRTDCNYTIRAAEAMEKIFKAAMQ